MPSKRKKNKRRMRRDQDQRRTLEDQFGSSGKGVLGVCVASTPVTKQVPVVKSSEPPPPVPVKTPIGVPDEVPPAEPIVERIPVTDAVKDEVLKTAQNLTVEVEEPAMTEKTENITVPVTEVTTSIDEPLTIPEESQIRVEDTAPVITEAHIIAEALQAPVDTKREVEAVAECPTEELVIVHEQKPTAFETIAEVKPVTETATADVVHVTEAVVEVNENAVEVVSGPAIAAMTAEAEPLDIQTVTDVTEGSHATSEPEKTTLEAAGPTEATEEPRPEQQAAPLPLLESSGGPVAEGFVVTVSSVAVKAAILEMQIPETTTAAPEAPSHTLAEIIPAPESEPVPKEIIQAQDELMAQVETEAKKAVDGSLTVDTVNGCLGSADVAIEG